MEQIAQRRLPDQPVKSVTIVGLGNIGAHLAELLARLQKARRGDAG